MKKGLGPHYPRTLETGYYLDAVTGIRSLVETTEEHYDAKHLFTVHHCSAYALVLYYSDSLQEAEVVATLTLQRQRRVFSLPRRSQHSESRAIPLLPRPSSPTSDPITRRSNAALVHVTLGFVNRDFETLRI